MADEEDLDVGEVEAELLDAFPDERRGSLEAGVDEDVALGRNDEVGGQVFAADVVEVVGDVEWGERLGPFRVVLRSELSTERRDGE
jgi:hypothetical protein